MSSYLWRYYLEDDAGRFQRLLQSSRSGANSSGFSGGGGGNPHHRKSNMTGNSGRPGSPPDATVLTKQQVRSTDAMGRSILHLACSEEKKLLYVTALLNNPLVDPAQADAESGWNALHRALYHGNISVAREILAVNSANWGLVKIKDHAGDAPFDVYGAIISDLEDTMIEDRKPEQTLDSDTESDAGHEELEEQENRSKGEEVFTWGSNKNLTLGFADGDDRQYPERVSFKRSHELLVEEARRRYGGIPANKGKPAEELVDATIMFSPLKIQDVQLSKFHSAILTDDQHSNLFICGFGNGGRLGFGDDQNTQFTYRALKPPLLPKRRVASIALGMDHTVAVMEDGEVYTWGSNKYGQLGYSVQTRTPQDEPIQTTPRLVQGLLKREGIIGCAASRTHTVVYTPDSVYTWGKNDGQLGILASSEDRNLATQSSPRKVSANCLTDVTILQAVAIDTATTVLLQGGDVWIFAGHGYSKLLFPIERFVGLPDAANITRYDHGLNTIQRITSGGDTVCAMSFGGNVFAIDVVSTLKERAEKSGSGRVPWICQHAWSMRKRHMAVRDVDVGTDGNIIIATRDGGVYQRTKRIRPKEGGGEGGRYKFSRVPGLTRITTVRSNTTGVFAAIRKDTDVMEKALKVDSQGLWEEFPEMYWADLIRDQLEGKWFESGVKPTAKEYEMVMKTISEDRMRELINMFAYDPDMNSAYDASISASSVKDLRIPIHAVALARSPVLRKLLASNGGQIGTVSGEITFIDSGKPHAIFNDVQLLTILNLCLYLYTDYVLDPWECTNVTRPQRTRYEALRLELLALATTLGLDVLSDSLQRRIRIPKSLDRDMKRAYEDPDFFSTADMILDLLNGETMAVHSAVMRSRCPFFAALYGDGDLGGGGGRWLEGRLDDGCGEPLHIDLTHISKETMNLVVSWLYYDWDLEGFDGIRAGVKEEDVDTFLDFVLDVLSAANELMLDRLGQICQKIIGRYVNTRNAAGLLSAVADAAQKGFKEAALLYVCLNMETMLENHLLDELDEDLMFDIDAVIHRYNARATQSGIDNQFARLLATHPELPDLAEREKKELIESYAAEAEEQALALAFRQSHGNLSFYGSSPGGGGNTPGSARKRGKQPVTTPRKAPAKQPADKEKDDEIFSMDSSDENGSDGDGNHPANTPVKQSRRTWAPLASPMGTPEQPSWMGAPGSFSTSPRQQGGPGTNSVPWSTPPHASKKVYMREIMAQASGSGSSPTISGPGKSALTASLSDPPLSAAALAASPSAASSPAAISVSPISLPIGGSFKKSQKERKKQHQKQPVPSPNPATSSAPKPVWNVPVSKGEVLHLKDVLASLPEKEAASASPPLHRPVVIKIPSSSSSSSLPTSTPPKHPNITPITPAPPRPPRPHKSVSSPAPAASRPSPAPQRVNSHHFHGIKLTLQEVMEQETAQKEAAKEYSAKRSLQEIQEEQEFMRWWEKESRRAQGLPDLEEEGGVKQEEEKEKGKVGKRRVRGGKKGSGGGGEKGEGSGSGGGGKAGRAPTGPGPARGSAPGARAGRAGRIGGAGSGRGQREQQQGQQGKVA